MKKTTQPQKKQSTARKDGHTTKGAAARKREIDKNKAAAARKKAIEKKHAAEHTTNKTPQNKSDMDVRIDSAMEKIIQDTIGNQPVKKAGDNGNKKSKSSKSGKRKSGTKKKGVSGWKIAAGVTGAVLVVLLAAYSAGAYYYKDKFFKGTTINNISCSNLTVEETEDLIRKKVEDYSIQVQFRGDKTLDISGQDIAYQYVSDGSVQKIMESQNPFTWIKGYMKGEDYKAGENIQYDKEALKAGLESSDSMKAENMEAPADAYVAFQDNQFVIIDEVQGTTVKEDVLLEALESAVSDSEKSISAEEAGAYEAPSVTKEDETLIHQRDVWNSCAAVTVTYTFGEKQEVLDGMDVKDWMSYDENGNYVENPEGLAQNIQNYVAWLADEYDTAGRDRVITSSATGEPVTVSGGSYGFQINQLKEREQLMADIMGHVSTVREPIYSKTGVVYGENDIGNTYVEVDLSSQHLWFYKDGALILDTDFVSGTYNVRDRRTPGGSYSLMYKQRDQVLRGRKKEDGTYEYESPVKYWMPFNGGIGFHDANWRGVFGGSIFMSSGSHGCINMPTSAARTLYENIEAGCPVLCFYRG